MCPRSSQEIWCFEGLEDDVGLLSKRIYTYHTILRPQALIIMIRTFDDKTTECGKDIIVRELQDGTREILINIHLTSTSRDRMVLNVTWQCDCKRGVSSSCRMSDAVGRAGLYARFILDVA